MERIIKIFAISLFVLGFNSVFAAEQIIIQPISSLNNSPAVQTNQTISVKKVVTEPQNVSATVPQVISFEKCTKKYMIPVDNLYYLSLASINANKFTIDEIQSKNGYILFTAAARQFMASVYRVDNNSAILKITPADNNYFFPLGVLTNFYKYIDLNLQAKTQIFN